MRTEEVIARLARDGRPVVPVAPTMHRLGRWALLAALPVAAGVLLEGVRPDFGVRLLQPGFATTSAAIVLVVASSAFAALSLSVPNDRRSGLVRGVPLAAAGVWSIALLASLAGGGSILSQLRTEPVHPACLYQIAIVGCVPAVLLWRDVRRAAPLELRWTTMLVAVAAFGAGALSAAITCPIDSAAHQVWWHWLPVLAAALASMGFREHMGRVA